MTPVVNYEGVTLYIIWGYIYTMAMIKKSVLIILTVLAVIFFLPSCGSTVNIREDMSPAEMIQRANEAMDRNRYSVAIQYYNALGERNPNNVDLIITSKYHIAFIHYKQNKYEQAREGLNDVLSYYNGPDSVFLPQHFRRLSQIVLESIDKKSN